MPRHHLRPLLGALFVSIVVTACGSDDAPDAGDAVDTSSSPGSTASPTSTSTSLPPPPPEGPTLHGVRYCEFLTIEDADAEPVVAEVWNTLTLNDCPADAWAAIDLDEVATETAAQVAIANGPRYWVLDGIQPGELSGSLEVRELSGIEMRSIAFVEAPPGGADDNEYTEISVDRETTFTFLAGREVYELTGPDGSMYVMQSYSQQMAPDLTLADLPQLGDRLALPDSWTFTSRVLTEDLTVEDTDGVATVVQDELANTYQRWKDGG